MRSAIAVIAAIALALLPLSASGQAAKKPAPKPAAVTKKAVGKAAAKKKAAPDKAERFAYLRAVIERQNATITDCASARRNAGTAVSVDQFEREAGEVLSKKFTELDFEKSEYVTTAEYSERVDSITRGFFGDTNLGVFILPVPDDRMMYNADQGRLFIKPVSFDRKTDTRLNVWEAEKKLATRKGQTRMGIPFTYEVWMSLSKYLEIHTPDATYDARPTVSILSSPTEAKALKANLRYLFFGSLRRPIHDVAEDEEMASLDSPYLVLTSIDTYYMTPECAILFDTATGKTYETYYVGAPPANP